MGWNRGFFNRTLTGAGRLRRLHLRRRCFAWVALNPLRRFILRDKIPAGYAVFIRSTENFRDLARPVPVTGADRCRPFQRVRLPGIPLLYAVAAEDRNKEVGDKYQLCEVRQDRDAGDKHIGAAELI